MSQLPRCTVCGLEKKPVGRSAPIESTYCAIACSGYWSEPRPTSQWPHEEQFPETFESAGIKCPKCGYIDGDSSELHQGQMEWDDDDIQCPNCEAKLLVSKTVSITYSTYLKVNQ